MAYKALYRMYRPQTFEEVVGQQHIVITLQNAIKTNKLSHAYLFSGPRGTGKTTVAKILGKAINCTSNQHKPCETCASCQSINKGNHPDIIEIDAASNNGVDEIRELIDKVKYAPLELKIKVYIIDEVHMLTTGAFNALLKTLEEPPSHVMFILATTEPHKVIPTIISRCQRFDFTKVSTYEIQDRLEAILKKENIQVEPGVTKLVAHLADGGLRDALSILEQVIAYSGKVISSEDVYKVYGLTTTQEKINLLKTISQRQVKNILDFLKEISIKSHDIKKLTVDLIDCLKDGLIYHFTGSTDNLTVLNEEEARLLNSFFSADQSIDFMDILMDTLEKYRLSVNSMSYFEVALLKMVHHLQDRPLQTYSIKEPLVETKKNDLSEPYKSVEVVKDTKTEELVIETLEKVEDDLLDIDDEVIETELEEFVEENVQSGDSLTFETEEIETQTQTELEDEDVEVVKQKNEDFLMDNLFDMSAVNTNTELSTKDLLLGLMQTASKEIRVNDEKLWKMKPYMHHLDYAKIARLLKDSTIKLSSPTFIVVEVDVDEEKHMISDPKLESLLKEFTQEIFKIRKKLFCVTRFEWSVALSAYMELKDKPELLPPPIYITLDEEDAIDENTKLELKIKDVVGHHVEVVIED
ncbi:MAG: DNA polymerase III subunit gamma/tau [Erysipelotrichia bacterium]|jgi:DNA polymerase-3 subunit gamma/tau|nr:DNA polymerase III subunit gamma/tau [Erysipelotrichia bacterium]